jgi:hypothetical protein
VGKLIALKSVALITAFLLFLMIIFMVTAVSAAAVDGYLVESREGALFFYGYEELLDSYALKVVGLPNGLFEDFYGKTPRALVFNDQYYDFAALISSRQAAEIKGLKFDLIGYTSAKGAKMVEIPQEMVLVSLREGKIMKTAVNQPLAQDQSMETKISPSTPPSQPVQATVVANNHSTVAEPDTSPVLVPESPGRQSETKLVEATRVTVERAQAWAAGNNANRRLIEIAPVYWEFGQITGINPEVLYAQAAYETGFGHFRGLVPASHNNWAGIKVAGATGNTTVDYDQFTSPEEGARAHFNHLSAYIGLVPVGEPHSRYYTIVRMPWAGTVKTLEELSGKWAPSAVYHERIVAMVNAIRN